MTMHAPVPADIEADAIADLIADARHVPVPAPRVINLAAAEMRVPRQRGRVIAIPEASISLLARYADYGTC